METTLHRQIKSLYAVDAASMEVQVGNFRIDAISQDGELIEIQHASLGALRHKTKALLTKRSRVRLRIVKPIVSSKRITTLDKRGRKVLRSRMSPKRCDWLELFMDLVHFATIFPMPGLTLEALLIEAEETRIDRPPKRHRGKAYKTVDICMISPGERYRFNTVADLMERLPLDDLPRPFHTGQLAMALGKPRWFAQKVVYCLRNMNGLDMVGKHGNAQLYNVASMALKSA